MINTTKGCILITILGWQLYIKNICIHPLLFSQRNGYCKGKVLFGKYWVEIRKLRSAL